MNKLCCIPCNDPPDVSITMTCTCCASTHNDNAKHCEQEVTVKKRKVCKSCCCRCKKLKRQSHESVNKPDNE